MNDLPSRKTAQAWLDQSDLRGHPNSLDEWSIVAAYASDRLVDREAIDYAAILLEYDPEFAARRAGMFDNDWALFRSELERAAIGGSDEK